jgi:hypothetical protein
MAFTYQYGDVETEIYSQNIPRQSEAGEEPILVLIGDGTTDSTTAGDPNTVYDLRRKQVGTLFGQESRIALYVAEARRQPQPPGIVKTIVPETLSIQDDDPASNSDTLAEYPVRTDSIAVTDGSGNDLVHEVVYEHSPTAPADSDDTDVRINPKRGVVAPASDISSYRVSYDALDYETVLSSSALYDSVPVSRTGLIAPIETAESVSTQLAGSGDDENPAGTLDYMRREGRAVKGLAGIEPNQTVDGLPAVQADPNDSDAYTDAVDRRGMYLAGPAHLAFDPSSGGDWRTALAGLAGRFAGNAISNPVYNDYLEGYGELVQSLRGPEVGHLRTENTIPIDDERTGSGGRNLRIRGNTSTKADPVYDDSYQTQRVLDRWLTVVQSVGNDLLGDLAFEDFQEPAETDIRNQWLDFVNAGVFVETVSGLAAGGDGTGQQNTDPDSPGGADEQEAFYIEFEQPERGVVVVGTGVAPTPVITGVRNEIMVSTAAAIGERASEVSTAGLEPQGITL